MVALSRASRAALLVAAAIATLMLSAASGAHAASGCGPKRTNGGEWRSYGHDYAHTRHQTHEKVISPADVPLLSPAWTFSTTDGGGEGDITGTPIVADGCVYVGTTRGWVFALNADTGERVWREKVPEGGIIYGALGVRNGRIYAAVSRTSRDERCGRGETCVGPYVVAFDQRTGKLDWATESIDDQPAADTYGSPVVFDGVLLLGVSGVAAELGEEAERYAFQGSMNFIDARTGRLLKKTWTIHPPNKPDDDFAGATIWSTPAIDRKAKVAYAGTGNPFRPQAEHERANAVLKFDVDRDSRTFGKVLGSYKGNVDEYLPGFSELPCYDFPGNNPPYYPQGIGACGDIDLDFGASANLFSSADGRKLVGVGQKSGVYHVFDAKTMDPVWTALVGPPTAVGGIVGSTAYDGHSIHGPITVPGYLWSVSAADGSYRWIAPTADGAHYGPPVAVANGVVYTVDLTGFLDAFDARTGAILAKRPLALGGTSTPLSLSWGGVSVARNTVYAAVGMTGQSEGFVVAFRPGGTSAVSEDLSETIGDLADGGEDREGAPGGRDRKGKSKGKGKGNGKGKGKGKGKRKGKGKGGDRGDGGSSGGGGVNPPIVAGPGASSTTYATPVASTGVGGPLSFANLDLVQHDVVSDVQDRRGRPLFRSPLIGVGQTAPIEGLDRVESGKTYGFFCSIHPGMRGRLAVR